MNAEDRSYGTEGGKGSQMAEQNKGAQVVSSGEISDYPEIVRHVGWQGQHEKS